MPTRFVDRDDVRGATSPRAGSSSGPSSSATSTARPSPSRRRAATWCSRSTSRVPSRCIDRDARRPADLRSSPRRAEEQERRLRGRGDPEAQVHERLAKAAEEIAAGERSAPSWWSTTTSTRRWPRSPSSSQRTAPSEPRWLRAHEAVGIGAAEAHRRPSGAGRAGDPGRGLLCGVRCSVADRTSGRTAHSPHLESPVAQRPRHDDEPADRGAPRARSTPSSRLVTLGATRARQINSYFGQLGEGLGAVVPPQVTSVARKPLSIAFEEIAADKIVGRRRRARRAPRPRSTADVERRRVEPPSVGSIAAPCSPGDASSSASPAASPPTRPSRSAAASSTPAPTWPRS